MGSSPDLKLLAKVYRLLQPRQHRSAQVNIHLVEFQHREGGSVGTGEGGGGGVRWEWVWVWGIYRVGGRLRVILTLMCSKREQREQRGRNKRQTERTAVAGGVFPQVWWCVFWGRAPASFDDRPRAPPVRATLGELQGVFPLNWIP